MDFKDFTKEDRERLDYLYGTDFKDIKPEDALLIARFETKRAQEDSEFKKHIELMENESKARIQACEAEKKQALANLQELHDAAIARLERVNNGK